MNMKIQFYSLLTEMWPFHEISEEQSQEKIIAGDRPPIAMKNTTDPYASAIIRAIYMCWTHNAR
jgi:hypothetical protein